MKYCYACGHTTGGEPLFCNSCGCSYDVKLCPKLHANPRTAEACSRCGSRDLSNPQPRTPLSWRLLALLAQALLGFLLLCLSVPLLAALFHDLARNLPIPEPLAVQICTLIILWISWMLLPLAFRRIIPRSLTRKSDSFHSHDHR